MRNPTRPFFCPNPDAGTTQIPVISNRLSAYKLSGVVPCSLAASIAFGVTCTVGNAYMAPSAGTQVIPGI